MYVLGVPRCQGVRQGVKEYVLGVPGGQGEGLRCPTRSTARFDESSNDLLAVQVILYPWGPSCQGECPRDSRGLLGWFDGSCVDS